MAKRKRWTYTTEFGADGARELDLTEATLRAWVQPGEVHSKRGSVGALMTVKREELAQQWSSPGSVEVELLSHRVRTTCRLSYAMGDK